MAKKVSFKKYDDATITEKIELDDLEPVEITFRAPSPGAMDALTLARQNADDEVEVMEAMMRFAARHIEKWSLDHKVNAQALLDLEQSELRFAVFNVVFEAGATVGN